MLKHQKIQNLFSQAFKFHQENKIEQASTLYHEVLSLDPKEPDTLNLLGIIAFNNQEFDKALKLHSIAIDIKPGVADFHNNIGNVYLAMEQLDKALEQFTLANQLDPLYIPAVSNIGAVYQEQNLLDQALDQYEKALTLDPDSSTASRNIANILWKLNRPKEAEKIYHSAMEGQIKDATYFHNIGNIYRSQGNYIEAEHAFKEGIKIAPKDEELNFDISFLQLTLGNFKTGWEHLTRKKDDFSEPLPAPRWNGCSLKGKSILIYGDQGIGDEIMFAQLIPEIAKSAKQCFVACEPRLVDLYHRSFNNIEIISGYEISQLSKVITENAIDVTSTISKLGKYIRPHVSDFPSPRPYLIADSLSTKIWKQRYQKLGPGLKIGISWKGGAQTQTSSPRTIELDQWHNLLRQENCHFINLQYGDQSAVINQLKQQHNIIVHHWEDSLPLSNMDNFAAQTAALDLVISIDNSTIHLSCALGTPTWLLTPLSADWRWGINKQDCLWYSCITLFRQKLINNWSSEFTEIIQRLSTIQANKSCLPYLSYQQLPTALFINNRADINNWGETCINDVISQTLNGLILKIDNIYSKELAKYKSSVTLEQCNNSVHLNSFCQSNPKLHQLITDAEYIVINGHGILGASDKMACLLLSIIQIAKVLYNKAVFLINLSITANLQLQQPVDNSIYQNIFSQLDAVTTQDSTSSIFLNQIGIEHTPSFSLIPLYIRNNYSLSSIQKSNAIVITGIEFFSKEILTDLAEYITLISNNGFTIQVLIEAKTEIKPTNHSIQLLHSLLVNSPNNWGFINCHTANTWLTTLAEAKLVISSQHNYLIAANFVQTPCITLDDNIENTTLNNTLNIHLPVELKSANLTERLIQNTLPLLDTPDIFLSPNMQLNTLEIQAKQSFAPIQQQIIQNTTLKEIKTADIEYIITIVIETLENQHYAHAIEILNIALNKHKKNKTLFYLQGLAHFHANNQEKALNFLFESLEIDAYQGMVYEEIALIIATKNCPSIDRWLTKLYQLLNENIQIFYSIPKLLPTLIENLQFNKPGVNDYKTQIYTYFISPFLISSAKNNLPELALYLENIIYNAYLYQKDSQEFFAHNVSMWVKDLESMGKAIASKLPPQKQQTNKPAKTLIAFFFHTESMLAHIIHITSLVSNYNQSDNNDFRFKAYFLAGHDDAMREYFKQLNIEIFNLTEHFPQADHFNHFLKLRDQIAIDNTQLLIWGCLGLFMPFAFGMRIAPHQAWLPVKYKGITINSIDHYLQFHLSGAMQTINNIQWISFNGIFNFHSSKKEYQEGKRIRSHYSKHPILLGTYARESIIRDKPFLNAVVMVLKKNPSCGYLWTGRNQDNYIQSYFEQNGVSKQTYFIGWVDINIYATVIDIFLDTFSFMCGHTLLRTMAAKKASISFQKKENLFTTPQNHQKIINMSNDLYGNDKNKAFAKQLIKEYSIPFMSYSYEEYIEKADKLINHTEIRRQCAVANSKIIDYYFHTPQNVIESTIDNLNYILEQSNEI